MPVEEEVLEEEDPEEPEIVIPTFSEEQVNAARDEGFANGREEGIREASEATERLISDTTLAINAQLTQLFDQQRHANAEIFQDAVNASVAIVRKCFPNLAVEHSITEIEHMMGKILPQILEEPRVVVNVHNDVKPPLSERMKDIIQNAHFDGRVMIREDASISHGDCQIEWSNGGAERNMDELWRQIDEIVESNLAATQEGLEFDSTPAPSPSASPQDSDSIHEEEVGGDESHIENQPDPASPSPVPAQESDPEDPLPAPSDSQPEMPEGPPPTPYAPEETPTENTENSAVSEPIDAPQGTPPSSSDPEQIMQSSSGPNPADPTVSGGPEDASMEPDAEAGILKNTADAESIPSPDQPA